MATSRKLTRNIDAVRIDLAQRNWIGTGSDRMLESQLQGMIDLRINLLEAVSLCDDVIMGLEKMVALRKFLVKNK